MRSFVTGLELFETMKPPSALQNQSIFVEFPYLNQTDHYLINSSSIYAQLVNVPYRTVRSLGSSIAQRFNSAPVQFPEEMNSTTLGGDNYDDDLIYETNIFWIFAKFSVSSYAATCLFVAVVLNRLVNMGSLRSTNQQLRIALWAKVSFHLTGLVTIGYMLYQTGAQLGLYGSAQATGQFLSRCYQIVCLSHCIETFIATTSNLKPLEESDFSLFELSSMFYQLSAQDASADMYAYTCFGCLMGRFIIHFVELLDIRKRRIIFSAVLNVSFSLFMVYRAFTTQEMDGAFIYSFSAFKNIPKILSVSIILLSYVCYQLSCLVRKTTPFGSSDGVSRVEELKYHSFWSNWVESLAISGEEDFFFVVMRFATFLCNPKQSQKHGIHREFEDVTLPTSMHKSYLISGYMNRIDPPPIQELDFKRDVQTTSLWRQRVSWYTTMLGYLFEWTAKLWTRKRKDAAVKKPERNYNDFVTEKNYVKFLHVQNEKDTDKYLLPEEDYTEDYVPQDDDEDNEDNDDDEYQDDEHQDNDNEELASDTQVTLAEELFGPQQIQEIISSPQEMSWYLSTWSILKYQALANEQMLTRRKFAKHNEAYLLQDVISEIPPSEMTQQETHHDHDTNHFDASDMTCVVCKTNQRNIILWPCKCFALCEPCRTSLGLRAFNTCICCRRQVSGYSKLNIV